MVIENKEIIGKNLIWILRCPTKGDGAELSKLRVQLDGETENFDREPGEGFLTPEDFEKMIYENSISDNSLFLVAEVEGKIVGLALCKGNALSRFRHKASLGIGVLKEYWGNGIGNVLLENILSWADTTKLEKISLIVIETNTKAIQLYKKYGFIEEGLLIKDRIHKDGNYYNTVIMGRISVHYNYVL